MHVELIPTKKGQEMVKDPNVPSSISIPLSLLNKVDYLVENNKEYKSRSAFILEAIQEKIAKEKK